MSLAIPFPAIDPILFAIGPFAIRWYALAYITGLVGAWYYLRAMVDQAPVVATRLDADDFLTWATLGVILGGRFGYVLFYNFSYYASDPLAALMVWRGGMSFHGGLLGVAIAGLIFVRRRGIPALAFSDMLACGAPIGLFLGRIANFINGELYGRITDVPWAIVFPRGGPAPRHPSQLYEAALEGFVLFAVLFVMRRSQAVRERTGLLTGVFFVGYAIARGIVETVRQPDAHLGTLALGSTMGQWLSVPLFACGLYFIISARRA
jgi:phosphatidylglycerol---prolipoprotein diacylglyceryl transferase